MNGLWMYVLRPNLTKNMRETPLEIVLSWLQHLIQFQRQHGFGQQLEQGSHGGGQQPGQLEGQQGGFGEESGMQGGP